MGRRKALPDNGDVRDALVDSALVLFAAKGFSSVSIKEIGRKSGFNSAMIYYYFKDKDAIFHQCLVSLIDRISAQYAAHTLAPARASHDLGRWLDTHRSQTTDIVNLLKLTLDYSRSDTKNPLIDAQIKRFYDMEHALIAAAVPPGSKPLLPIEEIAAVVSTHLDGIITRSIVQKGYSVPAALDRLLTTFNALIGLPAPR